MEKRRQKLLGHKYKCLDSFYRSFLFDSTDSIFEQLGLKTVLLDIDPSHCTAMWDIELRKALIRNLQQNNSLLINGEETDCVSFTTDTIRGERDIQPFLMSRRACRSAEDAREYQHAAKEHIEASVVLGDQRRNLLMLLGWPTGRLQFRPLMGAAISLTGVEGETELRWGFSKLDCQNRTEEALRDEIEGIFAYRLLAEGFFLEDLRVSRLSRRQGIVRSDRTKRFVSIVSSDMFLFPKGFVKTYLNMEGLSRHYNLSSSLDLRHGPNCRCRKAAEQQEFSLRRPYEGMKASAVHNARSKRLAPGSIATGPRRAVVDTVVSSRSSSPNKSAVEEDKIWSFYGISMFNFDRLLKAVYDTRLAGKNTASRMAISRGEPSSLMHEYLTRGNCWTPKKLDGVLVVPLQTDSFIASASSQPRRACPHPPLNC
eukprot:Gregarina_sp_Poly_1__9946@NODE_656_length_6918_cov_257_889943_g498_i0_p3_GENE_NODE_656_length_6918_cov_257_889943_g498_i0NODE_656_length_6918_cov_257_889943_g498_i0_p3_ORF_typecomplete_len427_score51_15_NODE_656_length_6918_cov_257_889943_g498_i013522632